MFAYMGNINRKMVVAPSNRTGLCILLALQIQSAFFYINFCAETGDIYQIRDFLSLFRKAFKAKCY